MLQPGSFQLSLNVSIFPRQIPRCILAELLEQGGRVKVLSSALILPCQQIQGKNTLWKTELWPGTKIASGLPTLVINISSSNLFRWKDSSWPQSTQVTVEILYKGTVEEEAGYSPETVWRQTKEAIGLTSDQLTSPTRRHISPLTRVGSWSPMIGIKY